MAKRLTPTRLAKRLRVVRVSLGWSQSEAAADLGVHRISLVRWENGTVRLDGMTRRLIELWTEKYGRDSERTGSHGEAQDR